MKILVIAKLKPSQIRYKIQPLLNSDLVDEIIVLRKFDGPKIPKLKYIILPKIFKYRIFYVLFTPFFSIYYSKKNKVDLIIGYHFVPHGFNAFITHLITRIPFIYAQIDMDIEQYCKNPLLRRIIKRIISSSIYVLVPGTRSKNFWLSIGIEENKIKILHSSIDTEKQFYPLKMDKKYDLLFIGTFDDNKRITTILAAVKALVDNAKSIKFAIAGFGPLENEVIKIIKRNNLVNNVSYLGRIDNVFELYNSSKIFIMASKYEGLPCSLMEAMACENLVITTPAGDIPDAVVDGYSGILIKEVDPISISKQIEMLLKHYKSFLPLAHNAREVIIENHSYRSATLKWNNLLNEVKNENID